SGVDSMRNSYKLAAAVFLLAAVVIASLVTGTFNLTFQDLAALLTGSADENVMTVFFDFRMPRIIITLVCRVAFAVIGCILQSISRKALSDPGIIGVKSGSGIGVVLFITFFIGSLSQHLYALPIMSFAGGLLTVLIIFSLSFMSGEFKS